jgi:surface-anchored protein
MIGLKLPGMVIGMVLGCSSAEPAVAPSAMGGAAGQSVLAGAAGDESVEVNGDGGAGLRDDGPLPPAGGGDGATAGVGGEADTGTSPAGDGGAAGSAGSPADSSCAADCEHCFREGHGDVFVDYGRDTGLRVMLRTELEPGQGERLHAPDSVCIVVGYQRYQVVADAGGRPESSAWEPLGVPEGAAFWQLPAVATAGTPWLGTAVAALPALQIPGQSVVLELSLPAAEAGAFSAYVATAFGAPMFLFSTVNGLTELVLQSGSHAHMNWTFAAPGGVELSFVARAEALDGTPITSDEATFRFVIEPP